MAKKNCASVLADEVRSCSSIEDPNRRARCVNRAAERYLACEARENPNPRAQPVLRAIRILLKVREEM
jgi:hypothetical protein